MAVGFDTFTSRMLITGEIVATTPLRIGTGKSADATESDQPVLKDVFGRPLIPGSSLKGALRSYIESILRAIPVDGLVCNVLDENEVCISRDYVRSLLDIRDPASDSLILEHTCLTCRLFGSNYTAAKLALRDLSVVTTTWGERYMLRDGVAINRDTGIAEDQKKYDLEAVPAGTRFQFAMQVDNADEIEQGLALLAVSALERGQVQIGGGRSRGLGWCRLEVADAQLHTDAVAYLLGEPADLTDTDRQTKISAFRSAIGR